MRRQSPRARASGAARSSAVPDSAFPTAGRRTSGAGVLPWRGIRRWPSRRCGRGSYGPGRVPRWCLSKRSRDEPGRALPRRGPPRGQRRDRPPSTRSAARRSRHGRAPPPPRAGVASSTPTSRGIRLRCRRVRGRTGSAHCVDVPARCPGTGSEARCARSNARSTSRPRATPCQLSGIRRAGRFRPASYVANNLPNASPAGPASSRSITSSAHRSGDSIDVSTSMS